jgi:zinc protease
VKEERRLRSEDDPQGALVEACLRKAFMSHPYHWPVIGWFADLDAMTLEDLQRHYDTFYSPNNATLIVVGDIKADVASDDQTICSSRYREDHHPNSLSCRTRTTRRAAISAEARSTSAVCHDGVSRPNYSSDDSYALDVLESILSRGKSSRLYQSLVYEQKNSLSVGAEYSLMQTDPGLFYFYSLVNPSAKVETVEVALQREIAKLHNEPPSDEELQRAKNQIEASRTSSNRIRIFAMPCCWDSRNGAGWRRVDQFVERIRAVTAKDIQRVAKQYLTEDNRTLGILVPLPPSLPKTQVPPSRRKIVGDHAT